MACCSITPSGLFAFFPVLFRLAQPHGEQATPMNTLRFPSKRMGLEMAGSNTTAKAPNRSNVIPPDPL
jgi:hypothetical protein